ncbi:MAG: phosphatase PAP2 family protein [Bacteroidota bacterium]
MPILIFKPPPKRMRKSESIRRHVPRWGIGLAALALGTGLTVALVGTGLDWWWANIFPPRPHWVVLAVPFVLAGMVVPLAIPLVFYLRYRRRGKERDRVRLCVAVGSLVPAFLLSTVLKMVTNRVDMEPFASLGALDFSAAFRFGFMNGDNWWESLVEGWPSGHTLVTVAMAVALHPLLHSSRAKTLNVLYAIAVPLAVSTSFHWLSDVAAGAVMGVAIGGWRIDFRGTFGRNLSRGGKSFGNQKSVSGNPYIQGDLTNVPDGQIRKQSLQTYSDQCATYRSRSPDGRQNCVRHHL